MADKTKPADFESAVRDIIGGGGDDEPTNVGVVTPPGNIEFRKIWEIVRRAPTGRENPANAWWTQIILKSIRSIAQNNSLDTGVLTAVLVARFGNSPPSDPKAIRQTAKQLANIREDADLDRWFENRYGTSPTGISPLTYIKRITRNKDLTVELPAGREARTGTLYERVSPAWEPVMRIIKEAAARTRGTGNDVIDSVPFNELFAAIWAAGYKPGQLRKNPEIADRVAQNFATARRFGTLNDWFRSVYGKPAEGRTLPDRFLRGVQDGRGFPGSLAQDEREREVRRDFQDPEVFEHRGVSVRTSDMQRLFTRYQPIFQDYQGRDPTNKELIQIVKKGKSDYQLAIDLSNDPRFFRSRLWKKSRLAYVGTWNDMMGATKRKPPRQLIRKAIINNWGPGQFAEALRGRKDYLESNEFNSNVSSLQNVYATVFGGPITSSVKNTLREAALARWSPDQFAGWLRAQPEYGTSVEFTSKVRNLNTAMSNAFGTPERRVRVPPPQAPSAFDLPDSRRIEGAPGLAPVSTKPAGSEFE